MSDNRPGLPRLDYRLGNYAGFRQSLLAALNRNPVLTQWTHREPDDPALALLEGAAILADILSFYQDFYANEAFLRTARFPENIAELVRLVGYRLSPGLGGEARFAVAVRGAQPVVIPKGWPVKAPLAAGAAEFESSGEVTAYPGLSHFSLYPPFVEREPLTDSQTREFYVNAGAAPDLAAGDRLLAGARDAANPAELTDSQILVVEAVRDFHGAKLYRIKGQIVPDLHKTGRLAAWKIRRTFRHFGYNSPLKNVKLANGVASQVDVAFYRDLIAQTTVEGNTLAANQLLLDVADESLTAGTPVICQALAIVEAAKSAVSCFASVARNVVDVAQVACSWGMITGKSTRLTLDGRLYPESWQAQSVAANIRDVLLHEVEPGPFELRPAPRPAALAGSELLFFGRRGDAAALDGRPVFLATEPEGAVFTASVSLDQSRTAFEQRTSCWRVSLDRPLPSNAAGKTAIEAFGNLVPATQGKTENETVLGNGDNRQIFQTFKLPKKPLTFLEDIAQTPPERPELEIWVNQHRWEWVPTFFEHGPEEEIFIVRQDAAGASWVQFGDGKTGARLPSGVNNVKAKYRTGIGASGALTPDGNVQAKGNWLEKIDLPGPVTRGRAPESGDHARQAAPGRVQGLGRLVSLQDYENLALSLGLDKAAADWAWLDNMPTVRLTVLADEGEGGAWQDLQARLDGFNRSLGPARSRVKVEFGTYIFLYADVSAVYDPACAAADVERAIRAALGQQGTDEGLLSQSGRRFGQPEYDNRLLATVQNVPGVRWAVLNEWGYYNSAGQDPAALKASDRVACAGAVDCGPTRILSLPPAALTLRLTADTKGAAAHA